jgi:hypothetical protein
MMRACGPVQLFGLIQDKGVTTLATPRSQTTSAGSVYHARLERDSIIEMRGARYKAVRLKLRFRLRLRFN